MPRAAPRIDARLVAGLARLDEPSRSIAETHRMLGALADELGLTRPSYEQTRNILHSLRARRRDPSIGAVLLDINMRVRPPEALLDVLAGTEIT